MLNSIAADERTFVRDALDYPPPATNAAAPHPPRQRIHSIDVLRGVALLGILFININSFALPYAAYTDPTAYGGATGANLATWTLVHILFEGKMRTLFCMLFGASVVIMLTRPEKKTPANLADIHYRRSLWLIAFGALHGYLIWSGDILFHFGVIALALYPLRKLSGRTLAIIGATLLTLSTLHSVRDMHFFHKMTANTARLESLKESGATLTPDEQAQLLDAHRTLNHYKPSPQTLDAEIRTARSGYHANLREHLRVTSTWHTTIFYRYIVWDVGGLLLLGMGLMKFRIFDASRSFRFYAWLALIGYGIGLPLEIALTTRWIHSNFDLDTMFVATRIPTYFLRVAIALGHIAVIMMICKSGILQRATASLAAVGRMALTNYLLTSILCTLIFNGYGIGLFGKLQRHQLLYIVAAMWTINLLLSVAWLKRFRFGPMEWLWRSLTYLKLQPMTKL